MLSSEKGALPQGSVYGYTESTYYQDFYVMVEWRPRASRSRSSEISQKQQHGNGTKQ